MFQKGDFHIHTNASDGELCPTEVIMAAKERGTDIIAISDHNTVSGIDEAIDAGRKYGVAVVPAVEISSRYKNKKVHVLGYFRGISFRDKEFIKILKLIKAHSAVKIRKKIVSFNKEVQLRSYLSTFEVIQLLRAFDASVVLAHPVRIDKNYLLEVLQLPFDGIEASYCKNTCTDTEFFIETAITHFSFYTAGSDFHTNKKVDNKHCLIGNPSLNSDEIENFIKKSGAMIFI